VGPLIRFKPILELTNLGQARTPLAAAYDSVITNLKKAEVLIPEFYDAAVHEPAFQVRANRFAASALLAKVYWQQNDFDNALIQVNKVLGNTPGTSNFPLAANFDEVYKRLGTSSNTATKSEVILEYVARAPSRISTRAGQVTANTWYRPTLVGAFFGNYFKTISKMDSINDKRFKDLITPNYTQTTAGVTYSSVWVTKKFSDNANIPFIRSAELLLMRAEINARKGLLAEAKSDLDLIRNRAQIGAYTITTQQALIEDIITERIREMHAEGYRAHELKRLGALTDGQPDEVRFERGNRADFDCGQTGLGCTPVKWNDRRLTYLIPNEEINVNPLATNP
jgi:tetratricopeptide (TPR) repeat protein